MSATGSDVAPAPDGFDLLMVDWDDRERPRTPRARALVEQALALSQRGRATSSEKPKLPAGNAPQVLRGLALGRVPALYRTASWTESPAEQAEKLRRWCVDMPDRLAAGGGICMSGLPSRGKSFAAALVAQRAVQHGYTVRWAYVPHMLDMLRRGRTDRERINLFDSLVDADLAVFDDFGVASMSEWDVSLVDEIAELRYSRRRSMIVTTNLSRKTLDGDEALARLMARWNDRNRWLYFTGPALRSVDGSSGQPMLEGLKLE